MTDFKYEQELLDDWNMEYELDVDVKFGGYTSDKRLIKNYDGICKYPTSNRAYSLIYLKPMFEGKRFAVKCALWHEFAHHLTWVRDGVTGHGWKWILNYVRKPLLVVGMFLSIFTIL